MTTVAIVGAGAGLGRATAHRFGREGHSIALISRTQANVDRIAAELNEDGINVRGYTADVQDRDALEGALDRAAAELGAVEVLQYSPVPQKGFLKAVLDTTVQDLAAAIEFSVLGAATAVAQVLAGMRQKGRGTVLLVNGSSAATPNATVAGTSTAFAAESAYGRMLHDALAPENIHVGQLIIPGAIGGGDPLYAPEALAEQLYSMHSQRRGFRTIVGEGAA